MFDDMDLATFRELLHKNGELSHKEIKTSQILNQFFENLSPDEILYFNHGLGFIYDSGKTGDTIVFRADMDALPIEENNNFSYRSEVKGISHLCGHDGHMTIVAGLGRKIADNRPKKGKVILLFQPAEEVGEGAKMIVESNHFKKLSPDYIFGLHNIPGEEYGKILLREGSFAFGSRGMVIKLFGKESHAGEPEKGISPVNGVKQIIEIFQNITQKNTLFKGEVKLTFIHINVGKEAFGTSPGYGEVMLTLRSEFNEDMDHIINHVESSLKSIADSERLKYEVLYKEIFPATINNNQAVDIVYKAVKQLSIPHSVLTSPYKWSEDFSYFSSNYKAAFFGLGSGVDQPNLHNPKYDFPNQIIDRGIELYYQIYKQLLL